MGLPRYQVPISRKIPVRFCVLNRLRNLGELKSIGKVKTKLGGKPMEMFLRGKIDLFNLEIEKNLSEMLKMQSELKENEKNKSLIEKNRIKAGKQENISEEILEVEEVDQSDEWGFFSDYQGDYEDEPSIEVNEENFPFLSETETREIENSIDFKKALLRDLKSKVNICNKLSLGSKGGNSRTKKKKEGKRNKKKKKEEEERGKEDKNKNKNNRRESGNEGEIMELPIIETVESRAKILEEAPSEYRAMFCLPKSYKFLEDEKTSERFLKEKEMVVNINPYYPNGFKDENIAEEIKSEIEIASRKIQLINFKERNGKGSFMKNFKRPEINSNNEEIHTNNKYEILYDLVEEIEGLKNVNSVTPQILSINEKLKKFSCKSSFRNMKGFLRCSRNCLRMTYLNKVFIRRVENAKGRKIKYKLDCGPGNKRSEYMKVGKKIDPKYLKSGEISEGIISCGKIKKVKDLFKNQQNFGEDKDLPKKTYEPSNWEIEYVAPNENIAFNTASYIIALEVIEEKIKNGDNRVPFELAVVGEENNDYLYLAEKLKEEKLRERKRMSRLGKTYDGASSILESMEKEDWSTWMFEDNG